MPKKIRFFKIFKLMREMLNAFFRYGNLKIFAGLWLLVVGVSLPLPGSAGVDFKRISAQNIRMLQSPQLAGDGVGNALAVWVDDVDGHHRVAAATYCMNVGWSPSIYLSDKDIDAIGPAVACSLGGAALVVWQNQSDMQLESSWISSIAEGVWSSPMILSAADLIYDNIQVAIAPNLDLAIAVWDTSVDGVQEIYANTFSAGAWSSSTGALISDATFNHQSCLPSVAVNDAGNALAVWVDYDSVNIRSLAARPFTGGIGGEWGPVSTVTAGSLGVFNPRVGIDQSDTAISVWELESRNQPTTIETASYNFSNFTWSSIDVLSVPGKDSCNPSLAVDPTGAAVAAWTSRGIQSSYRPAKGWWQPVKQISNSQASDNVKVSINDSSRLLAVWEDGHRFFQLHEAVSWAGGTWTNPWRFSSESSNSVGIRACLDCGHNIVAVWEDASDRSIKALVRIYLPDDALNIYGKSVRRSFISGTKVIHTLSWDPSIDPAVVAYRIYRNSKLIVSIPSVGPHLYVDYDASIKTADVYTVKTVNLMGQESYGLSVTLY